MFRDTYWLQSDAVAAFSRGKCRPSNQFLVYSNGAHPMVASSRPRFDNLCDNLITGELSDSHE